MLRMMVVAALLCVSACVSSDVQEGALAACEAQHVPPEEMNACRARMEGTLQAARDYRPRGSPANQP